MREALALENVNGAAGADRPAGGGSQLGHIPAIEGLRAVAVVTVILFHLHGSLLPGGFTGVDVFFVISGFVVTGSMLGRRFGSIGELLLFFYARRLVRIIPALLFMLLVAILATQLFVPNAWLSADVKRTAESAFVGASNIALAMMTDSYFSPRSEYNPFVHTWSLGVEEQFYLLFPFIMYWHQRGRVAVSRRQAEWLVASLSVLSLVACAALGAWQHRYAFYLIPARFWELGVGMLMCLTIGAWRPRLAAFGGAARAAWLGASLLALLAGFLIPESRAFPFPLALLPVAGSAGVIAAACALPEARPCRWLAAPLPRLVGRLSYSLYLWHWPVFVLFRWTVGLDGIGSCLAALAIAVALASLSYAWVEAPIRSSGRIRGVSRHKVVLTSLVLVAVAGSAGVTMFHLHNRLTLSRTGNAVAWYANDTRPLNPAWTRCEPVQTRRSFLGGLALSWTPRHCRTAPGQLFVVGDSFARAYLPAARQFAADTGMTVRLYSLPACGFVPLNRPMPVSGDCHDFVVAAYRDLKARFRPGDVLFITDRRIDPLVEEGGPPPPASPWPDAERDRALALREGRMWLLPLAAAGLRIVQEAPKPIFRAAPFRCVDWFNRGNSICAGGLTMAAAELQAMRAPVLRSQRRLAATVPGVSLWDPFPILCPGAVCRAIGPDGPRFTDSDHLSGHGNDLLYPGFRAAILAAMPSPAKRLAAATVAGPAS